MGGCIVLPLEGYNNPSVPDPRNRYYDYIVDQMPLLENKVIAITGTSSGMGLWLAVTAMKKHAGCIILLNRESMRAKSAAQSLFNLAPDHVDIIPITCDLKSFRSVRTAAEIVHKCVQSRGGLDVLCCNAGVIGQPDTRTEDGYDVQMQTNYLSHALLSRLLMSSLEAAAESRGEARLVMHSSGQRNNSGKLKAANLERCPEGTLGGDGLTGRMERYAQSKLAQTIFSLDLSHQLAVRESNVKSISCEPGLVQTNLASNMFATDPDRCVQCVVAGIFNRVYTGMGVGDGCGPLINACFAPETNNGDLIMPRDWLGRWGGAIPVKPIVAGVEQKIERSEGTDESLTMDMESRAMLWEKTMEATHTPETDIAESEESLSYAMFSALMPF